jgi:hypothetical protein
MRLSAHGRVDSIKDLSTPIDLSIEAHTMKSLSFCSHLAWGHPTPTRLVIAVEFHPTEWLYLVPREMLLELMKESFVCLAVFQSICRQQIESG